MKLRKRGKNVEKKHKIPTKPKSKKFAYDNCQFTHELLRVIRSNLQGFSSPQLKYKL